MQEKVNNFETSENAAEIIYEFLRAKKATYHDWPTCKGRYSKNLKKKKDLSA